jgi:hypothetical protein
VEVAVPESQGNVRLAVLATLISAVGSVVVAYIGILPQIEKPYLARIKDQEKNLKDLRDKFGVEHRTSEAHLRWTISGRVRRAGASDAPGQYEVYLVAGNSNVASPGDDGRFTFDGVFPGSYSLIVRDIASPSNQTARGLITPSDRTGRLESHGAFVEYDVVQEPDRATEARTVQPTGPVAAQAALAHTDNGGLQ